MQISIKRISFYNSDTEINVISNFCWHGEPPPPPNQVRIYLCIPFVALLTPKPNILIYIQTRTMIMPITLLKGFKHAMVIVFKNGNTAVRNVKAGQNVLP